MPLKPWKGQPVLRKRMRSINIILSRESAKEPLLPDMQPINNPDKMSSLTLAVRRLVPKITSRVFAENISAFLFSAICL